jgi:VWFA-related protein
MRKIVFCSLIMLGLASVLFAQSGRKIRYPIPGTTTSGNSTKPAETEEVGKTETAAPTAVGFSESAPTQPVSIYIDRKRRKEKKEKAAAPTPTAKPTTNQTASEDDEVIKVDTKLISIPVTVYEKSGLYVPSLSKPNFQIFEDGKEQEIAYFGTVDKPFSTILLLDVSGSLSEKMKLVQDSAVAFVNQMYPQDRVMVIAFDDRVKTLCEFTNDKTTILNAIGQTGAGGGTAIYEAVEDIIERKFKNVEGKKSIILFTDGVDSTSNRSSYESSIKAAMESEAVIFPIYYNTFLDSMGIGGGGAMQTPPTIGGIPGLGGGTQNIGAAKEVYALGRRYLQDLANATSGRIYKADNSQASLSQAFEGIAEELRSQYEVGYYPDSNGQVGEVKKIKVRINRPNLVIRSRDSYVVK